MPHPDPRDLHSQHKQALYSSVIAMPLRQQILDEQKMLDNPKAKKTKKTVVKQSDASKLPKLYDIIIDLNLEYPGKRDGAREWVVEKLNELVEKLTQVDAHKLYGTNARDKPKNQYSQQYLFVKVEGAVIKALVEQDLEDHNKPLASDTTKRVGKRAIYHIWSDFAITSHINKSIATIKGDAAHSAYSAFGEGIVWAVMDSGIDKDHKHFKLHENLVLEAPLRHTDFTSPHAIDTPEARALSEASAVTDAYGHGTHVAGIIAGCWPEKDNPSAFNKQSDALGKEVSYVKVNTNAISGIALKCKLLSLRVLDDTGAGNVSNLIAAIALVQEINGYGRRILIHGVNMSVGYEFKPEWFACGQSPLCVEVNRLVKSGVAVVVAAGNTGYGTTTTMYEGAKTSGLALTINDPGNADLAITVGSTHRDMPHIYGVSYFSSKGPTGDGRLKPDLVAPGERILSCAAGKAKHDKAIPDTTLDYVEETGTSMAAPHVSGAIAAFLSIRREFIGQPEQVKEIFMGAATDLKREKNFQGSGLVDLMRAIQSV